MMGAKSLILSISTCRNQGSSIHVNDSKSKFRPMMPLYTKCKKKRRRAPRHRELAHPVVQCLVPVVQPVEDPPLGQETRWSPARPACCSPAT
jgi:hypothetical protein